MSPQVTANAQVAFVGAGPGDLELITLKAKRLIEEADVIIYTDSLVNPEVASFAKPGAVVHRSAGMNLEQICALMISAVHDGKRVARVHTGDPAIFGAVLEQIVFLEREGITWEIVPGVSSMFAAAAALGVEFTIPELTQT
ncbi:MAG: cobalt-precorrin-4/precorrin-4 C(11)-methyltransferase, partial [Chloroflexi bacterium]|nr:cobalt-precorrin-4/precorrin-4 C(11)-methyltransferase [Chloroflexota bacterium]